MSNERDFKGVWIPKEVWLNKNLTPIEKFFLIEIESLDNEKGCYASNAHFSELFGLTKGRCTQIIKSLEAKNVLTIHLQRDGKLIKKRTLKVVNILNRGYLENDRGVVRKCRGGYLENAQGNNTKEQYNKRSLSKNKFSDDDLILAKFIFEKIKALNPENKKHDLKKWAEKIRVMREQDNRTHKQIQDVFVFSNQDGFWQGVIIGIDSLRKNFDKLLIKKNKSRDLNKLSQSYIEQHAKPGESYEQARARLEQGRKHAS